jgi:hypothetical protein
VLTQATQYRKNIIAYAADAKLDYVPLDTHQTRVTLEGIVGTGDADRGLTNTTLNGNAGGSDDRAFNGFGLVSTGLAFGAPVSNLEVVRLGASTFPLSSYASKRLQLGMPIFTSSIKRTPTHRSTKPRTKAPSSSAGSRMFMSTGKWPATSPSHCATARSFPIPQPSSATPCGSSSTPE